MNIISQVLRDLRKYKDYITYTVKAELKVSLSSTYLGYVWWLLDPLLYMLAYMLVVMVIFKSGDKDFPVFVFCALLSWKWTSSAILMCTNSIKGRAGILQQVYLPKFILPMIKILVSSVNYIFGMITLLVLIILFDIPFTVHLGEFIFVFIGNMLLLFAFGFMLAHLGVYFKDINNILSFVLRLWFYVSPGLYSLERVPEQVRFLWWLNPMTTFYMSYRNVFMYGKSPLYLEMGIWGLLSIVIIYVGLRYLYKFDKNYTKVV